MQCLLGNADFSVFAIFLLAGVALYQDAFTSVFAKMTPSSLLLVGDSLLAKQDVTGKWGGSLILSTSAAGTDSSSTSSQLVDRLTLDSTGLATFTGGLTLTSTSSSLTASGNTVLGATGAQSLLVNAASSFTSPATFTALTANGNVQLGANSGQTLTVPATASFSAPVTVASTMRVTGLATLTAGVALTTPVTVNGTALASVATTNSYLSLQNRPLFYRGSSTFSSAATGAPASVIAGTWFGTVQVVGSSGAATAYPTADGNPTGAALFTSILSVQIAPYQPLVSNAISVAYAAVKTISSDMKTVSLVAVTGNALVIGGVSAVYAHQGTQLMCTISGAL